MITFVDLFSGMGGFTQALQRRGMECVFSCDINPIANKIYEETFNHKPRGDITNIPSDHIPDHDVLCAGFPCQPFSTAGNHKGFKDERGMMFHEIMRIAHDKKPKVLLLENVPQLKRMQNGKYIEEIRYAIQDIGYNYYDAILNSADYGVPQARKRLYIVAVRNDITNAFYFPQPFEFRVRMKEILQDVVSESLFYKKPYHMFGRDIQHLSDRDCKKIGFVGLNIKLNKSGHVNARGGQGQGIYDIDFPAPTLTTGMIIYIMNENKVRKLSVREMFYVMGYDDLDIQRYRYERYSYSAMRRLLGNSVCLPVIRGIATKIKECLSQ